MIYLIPKIAILLVAAAAMGFLLGKWWIRRQFIDVTEEHRRLVSMQSEHGPQLAALNAKLKALGPSDRRFAPRTPSVASLAAVGDNELYIERLGSVEAGLKALLAEIGGSRRLDTTAILERLGTVEAAIGAQPKVDLSPLSRRLDETQALIQAIQVPDPVDIKPVQKQLGAVQDTLQCIRLPDPVDVKPLQKQVIALYEAIKSIHIPESIDLRPVQKQIAALERAVHSIEIPVPPDPVDLNPLKDKLGSVISRVDAIQIPPATDLTPLQGRLNKIDQSIQAITIPEPPAPPDLMPLSERIAHLEQAVARLPLPPDVAPIRRKLSDLEEHILKLPTPDPVDLKPLHKQVASVKEALYGIIKNVPEVARARVGVQRPIETNGEAETVTVPSAADEAPWEERIAALEQTMADLPLMGPENLEPLHERLARLEAMLGQALTSPSAQPPQPEQRPLLFDA
ncbi:MAG: hypothetical protein AAFN74_23810, partial [Myxococcota bacterium]